MCLRFYVSLSKIDEVTDRRGEATEGISYLRVSIL